MKNEDEISIRAFAKLINVSHVAVMNAIKSGKIRDGVSENGKIIPSIALQEAVDNSVGYANNVQQKYFDTSLLVKPAPVKNKSATPTKFKTYKLLYDFGLDVQKALKNIPNNMTTQIIRVSDPNELRQMLLQKFITELKAIIH
jgi:hypothetical protein